MAALDEEEAAAASRYSTKDTSDDVTSSGSSSDDDGGNSKPSSGGPTGELASLSETFSFGDRRRKVPCLAAGWFLACISGCIYPAMAFVWARIFEVLGTDPTAPDFMEGVRTQAFVFLGLGGLSFVSMTVQNTLLEIAAAVMTMSLKTR